MVAPRFFARAASITVAAIVLGAALPLGLGIPSAASAAPVPTLVAAPDSAIVRPIDRISVTALITNPGSTPLGAGTLSIHSSKEPLLDAPALASWTAGKTGESGTLAEISTEAISPRSSISVTISFPATRLPHPSEWGARGLSSRFTVDGTVIARSRSTIVLTAGREPAAVRVATVVPLVGAPSALGLLSADELAEATGPSGYLTAMLAATQSKLTTLAVDPRITTSILALGQEAPKSATSWLKTLQDNPQPGFWLTFADSDLSGQVQAGASSPVIPGLSDIANIPAPNTEQKPNNDQWPGWAPSLSNVGWPLPASVSTRSLKALTAAGYTRLLLSSTNVSGAIPASSSAVINSASAGIVNQVASACAERLEHTMSFVEANSARSCLTSSLAVAATEHARGASVIVTLSRQVPTDFSAGQFERTLDALVGLPFGQPTTLGALLAATPSPATLASKEESSGRLRVIKTALAHQKSIESFSTVAQEPSYISDPGARRLAAIVSNQWLGAGNWDVGVSANAAMTREVLTSVAIVTSSTINMVGGQARIPVVVRNGLPTAVTVLVHALPSNGRLVVERDVTVTIEANAQGRAYIPVSARVGSGRVELEVSLTDLAGNRVGETTLLPVNVRADWEGWGLIVLAVIFVGLITAGVIRTLSRRRRSARGQNE